MGLISLILYSAYFVWWFFRKKPLRKTKEIEFPAMQFTVWINRWRPHHMTKQTWQE